MFRMFVRNFSVGNTLNIAVRPPISVFGIEGRYVTALYSAASQSKQLDEVEKALRSLQAEIGKPSIRDFIATSLISRAVKSKLLIDIAKSAGMPDTAANFLGIVAENGRLKLLRRMINMFLGVMVAHRKEALCEVITAKPLAADEREALMAALKSFVKEGKNIQLTEKVDESVIGGIVVGIEDKHIDLSIARKLLEYSSRIKVMV